MARAQTDLPGQGRRDAVLHRDALRRLQVAQERVAHAEGEARVLERPAHGDLQRHIHLAGAGQGLGITRGQLQEHTHLGVALVAQVRQAVARHERQVADLHVAQLPVVQGEAALLGGQDEPHGVQRCRVPAGIGETEPFVEAVDGGVERAAAGAVEDQQGAHLPASRQPARPLQLQPADLAVEVELVVPLARLPGRDELEQVLDAGVRALRADDPLAVVEQARVRERKPEAILAGRQ